MVLLHIHDVFFQSRDACHGNLSHEIVERVLHTSLYLSLSLSLLSENYNDALLFYTCERFFHDKETIIECNFTWKNKEEIRSTD